MAGEKRLLESFTLLGFDSVVKDRGCRWKRSLSTAPAEPGVLREQGGRFCLTLRMPGGADRSRTDDLRLARAALSQLSYSPYTRGPIRASDPSGGPR